MPNSSKRTHLSRKFFWPLLVGVLLIGAGLFWFTNHSSNKVMTTDHVSANQSTKGEPASSSSTGAKTIGDNSSGEPGDQKSDNGGSSTLTLLDPTGNFVSNHHPGENGSPTTETSVCTTTPGASCKVSFTKDDVTKSLDAQTTDRGGSAYWSNWKPADLGLTSGSWQVQAIATLNGQTKTADDATALVVQ